MRQLDLCGESGLLGNVCSGSGLIAIADQRRGTLDLELVTHPIWYVASPNLTITTSGPTRSHEYAERCRESAFRRTQPRCQIPGLELPEHHRCARMHLRRSIASEGRPLGGV